VAQDSRGHSLGSDLNPQLMAAALLQGAGVCEGHFVTVRLWYAGEQAFEWEGVSRDSRDSHEMIYMQMFWDVMPIRMVLFRLSIPMLH